ncbi:MAG: hypothetical protein JST92_06905, partial [Deltaproteobacteria bacterium]|nr:hypothetical protein [Deltaproteobacteria bacterium]
TFADPAHPITLPSGVVTGTTVQLAASPVDPNAPSGSSCVAAVAPYRYAWTLAGLPPGSRAILNNAVAAAPSFTADIAGDYTVQLIVTDAAGNQSPRVSGTVTASSCTAPLTISGIGPQGGSTPTRGLPLPLTATVTDANAATSTCSGAGPFTPITYKWTFLDVPPGSTAQLRQSDTASPSFIPDQLGAYKVALTATDAKGLTGSNNATVTVAADCLAQPSASGITPASGTTAQAIQLSATGVTSPNATAACGIAGTTLAYSWTLVGLPNGSLATLNNPASSSPSFTPDVGGTYSVQLRLTDALGNQSAIVPQDITVATCNAPFAAAAITPPASPKVNTAFALGATYSDPNASTASCGLTGTASTTPVTSRWTLLSRPPGSNASFSDVTAASPSITPDLAGTYVAQVTLTDALGNQGSATLTTPVSGCGAAFDSAVTVTPSTRTPETGQGVTLAAKVTDGNASGCNVPSAAPFSYAWTLAPGGTAVSSTAILSNPTSASPAFTPDLPGLYDYSVVVTDALGYQGVFSSAARTASINARTCALSVAVAAPTSTNTGSAAQLTATPSFTCSTGTLATTSVAYAWTFDSVAKGSTAQLNNTSIPNPSFTLDVPASSWTVRVTVTDPLNNATATTSTTIASNDCFKNAPDGSIGVSAVSGGTNTSVSKRNTTVPGSADATYTLAGLGANASLQLSVNQLNGGTAATNPNAACASPAPSLNYHWGIYQLPPSSASNISPATAALPVMNIDKTGTYVIQLTVDDGTLTSVPVYYRIQIN